MGERTPRTSKDVPELNPASVLLLWVNDWYDTPSEAVVEINGARCLLRLESPEALEGDRQARWIVFALSPHERAELERVHERYATLVGTHWCFHQEKHDEASRPDPDAFFAAQRGKPAVDLAALVPMGWLASLPTR